MKHLFKNLLLLTTIGSFVFLFSCGEDDPEDDVFGAPSLSVTAAKSTFLLDDTIAFNVTYDVPGELGGFNYSFSATDGTETASFSKQFLSPTDLGLDGSETSGTFVFKPFNNEMISELGLMVGGEDYSLAGKSVTFKFELANAADTQLDSLEVSFSVEAGIETHTETLLGGPLNATLGSFYDSVLDSVYSATNAFQVASQPNIDLVFWFGTTSQYAIGATDDATAETAFESQAGIILANLATRNETRFKLLDAGSDDDFDAVASESDLLALTGETGITATSVITLAVDAVFAFRLDSDRDSKIGAAKVVAVSGDSGETRAITIQVKIQK